MAIRNDAKWKLLNFDENILTTILYLWKYPMEMSIAEKVLKVWALLFLMCGNKILGFNIYGCAVFIPTYWC